MRGRFTPRWTHPLGPARAPGGGRPARARPQQRRATGSRPRSHPGPGVPLPGTEPSGRRERRNFQSPASTQTPGAGGGSEEGSALSSQGRASSRAKKLPDLILLKGHWSSGFPGPAGWGWRGSRPPAPRAEPRHPRAPPARAQGAGARSSLAARPRRRLPGSRRPPPAGTGREGKAGWARRVAEDAERSPRPRSRSSPPK